MYWPNTNWYWLFWISAVGRGDMALEIRPSQCKGSIALNRSAWLCMCILEIRSSLGDCSRMWSLFTFTTRAIIYAGHWYTIQNLSAANTYPQNLNVLANPPSLKKYMHEYRYVANKFEGKNVLTMFFESAHRYWSKFLRTRSYVTMSWSISMALSLLSKWLL